MHFYAWQKGLKTGIYYLRRKAKHQAQQFTIVPKNNATNTTTSAVNSPTQKTPTAAHAVAAHADAGAVAVDAGGCDMCSG